MLIVILGNIDFAKLIYLRLLNKRWKGLIESMFNGKQSLLLTSGQASEMFISQCLDKCIYVGIRSLWLEEKDFAIIKLNLKPGFRLNFSLEFCRLLRKLFPKLDTLALDIKLELEHFNSSSLFPLLNQWVPKLTALSFRSVIGKSQERRLFRRINAMTALKQLAFVPYTSFLGTENTANGLAPTLARLKRFSVTSNWFDDLRAIVTRIGPNCTHLWAWNFKLLTAKSINECHNINPKLWSNLTHLHLFPFRFSSKYFEMFCHLVTFIQVLRVDLFFVRNIYSLFFDIF